MRIDDYPKAAGPEKRKRSWLLYGIIGLTLASLGLGAGIVFEQLRMMDHRPTTGRR